MSAMQSSPLPPSPPQPPRTGSNVIAIILLLLALIVLASGLAIYAALRLLSHNVQVRLEEGGGGRKEVSIKTPLGSLDVHPEVSEGELGLPIYPGARRVKGEDSAGVNLSLPGKEGVRLAIAKFATGDSLEKVAAFYREHLGNEVTKYTDKTADGKAVFELKQSKQDRVVALEAKGEGTSIVLVRVAHGPAETN
jgi:hypothetical protein